MKDMDSNADAAPRGSITVSINPFIPKPFTPFQWHGFEEPGVIERRYRSIKKGLSGAPRVRVSPVSIGEAHAQAYIARADRRAVGVIMDASTNGLRRAIKKIDPGVLEAALGPRSRGDFLPWDIIDHGVRKEYLWREYGRGLEAALTTACDTGTCMRCGVCTPEFLAG